MEEKLGRGRGAFSPPTNGRAFPGLVEAGRNQRNVMFSLIYFLLLIVFGGFFPLAAQAADITIDVDTFTDSNAPAFQACTAAVNDCSLRGAISKANADTANNYTINLPAGTYSLTLSGSGEDNNATGDLDILLGMTITGAGAATTIIDAGSILDRVFHLIGQSGTPINVNISGVTIQGGQASTDGGGIYINADSFVTLSNITLSTNTADGNGGGIFNEGVLDLAACLLESNTAINGGGLYQTLSGITTVGTSNFLSNLATGTGVVGGGGIYNAGSLYAETSALVANQSGADGGGIYNQTTGFLSATNMTFSANAAEATAGLGGGLRNLNTNPNECNLQFVTLNLNSAFAGEGISNAGFVGLKNTIVAGSIGGNCAGTAVTSLGSNLDSANTCGLTNTGDRSNTNPQLAALADNGGPTQTHALLQNSPAINAGALDDNVFTDQRLLPRPFAPNSPPDIGAFEYQGDALVDLVVTKTDQPDPVMALANLTYTITVTNNGPFAAHGILLTDTLDTTVNFVSVITSKGTCDHFVGIITCSMDLLGVNETATITVVVTPAAAILITNEISAISASYETETNPANNSTTVTTQVNNPVPTLLSLDPTAVRAGGPLFILTVTGTNFVSGAQVSWNGGALNTFHTSSTQLTAEVPALNIGTPGVATITVSNPGPGGGTTGSLNFQIQLYAINLPVIFKN